MSSHSNINKVTLGGLLVTLGIIYGDIGTSPLYVMKALVGKSTITEDLILGGISCVFWTLTLQTTLKYVVLTLRADNNGEGGIFSLYTLVKRLSPKLMVIAMIGGATLLADGIITPPISVSSAVEGLRALNPQIPTVEIVLVIISILFAFQRYGTAVVGKLFGPMMLIWFSMLGLLGLVQIVHDPSVFKALNPYYAWHLLASSPEGFLILGAVFLCTTGAEALYSDLGHCGRDNIRISWIFVKTTLVLNYMGQGVWLMRHEGQLLEGLNPFYKIMPEWFLVIGITIATLAAIIASQALISGSFTLIGEAVRLNLYPKVKVVFPTDFKGQLYIPSLNFLLWAGCCGIVLYFQESEKMEAAYGLAITLTMIMTTILMTYYLRLKRTPLPIIITFFIVYLGIEVGFLVANLFKFMHGGYVTVLVASVIAFIMWVWQHSSKVKGNLTEYVKLPDYLDQLKALSHDETLPKYATNLVFLSKARLDDQVENGIIYSILNKQPKRADVYWFVFIEVTDEPYTMEYKVNVLASEDVIRVHFRLGFRVPQRISAYLRQVIEEMVKNKEVNIQSRYHSLREQNIAGDFRFVVLEEVLSTENDLPFWDQVALSIHFGLKQVTGGPITWFGLDTSLVEVEKVPIIINRVKTPELKRIY